MIVFLFNGRPLSINYVAAKCAGDFRMLVSRPGNRPRRGGRAVRRFQPRRQAADLHSALGWPLPVFYNHKPSARRGYLFDDVSPLFPFGFGLSYTTFSIENVAAGKEANRARTDPRSVLVDVTNTGQRAGTEVVQMYIRDLVSSVTRPVKELKGFRKVSLQAGRNRRPLTFDITPESLAFYDVNMKYVVEPGEFEIMVGNSSRDADLRKVILRVAD